MTHSPHIIIIGNEKGGSGKTTTTMHLAISLLNFGFKVATIDLDHRQQSLSRYIENRQAASVKLKLSLPTPNHFNVNQSDADSKKQAYSEDIVTLEQIFAQLSASYDFILVDTPGSDTPINRLAHSYADTIITPINDSFVDLDLIGKISTDKLDALAPGVYSAMLWEQKMQRIKRNQQEINWILVRNRLSPRDAINKRKIEQVIAKLSKRFGFKVASGFGDRVIFKELFLEGLTLHDSDYTKKIRITSSVLSGRIELNKFIRSLNIPKVEEKILSIQRSKLQKLDIPKVSKRSA